MVGLTRATDLVSRVKKLPTRVKKLPTCVKKLPTCLLDNSTRLNQVGNRVIKLKYHIPLVWRSVHSFKPHRKTKTKIIILSKDSR